MDSENTVKHHRKPTNYFILLNESISTKNKMDYVFYLILCVIMLTILVSIYKKYFNHVLYMWSHIIFMFIFKY